MLRTVFGEEQRPGDVGVGAARRDQVKHLALAGMNSGIGPAPVAVDGPAAK
jgi:hypothetical protein